MPTVAHASDLHLSPRVPDRQAAAEPVLLHIADAQPDLCIITGDLTDDGWDRPDDLHWAKAWLDERLTHAGVPYLALPGNHDVGNFIDNPQGTINADRIAAWRSVFGDNASRTLNPWRLITLNSMLLGSNLPDEHTQRDWLDHQLADAATHGQRVAVNLHSPLFVHDFDEPDDPYAAYWLGPYAARQALARTLRDAGVTLLASGHVHQSRIDTINNTTIAWAPPASGTFVHSAALPNPPTPRHTGYLHHTLTDAVTTTFVPASPARKTVDYTPTA